MARLINTVALMKRIDRYPPYIRDVVKKELRYVPTVDPVKHGHWIRMSDADGSYYACSECGESLERKEHYDPQFDLFPRLKSIDKTQYCPNCGAKMDAST